MSIAIRGRERTGTYARLKSRIIQMVDNLIVMQLIGRTIRGAISVNDVGSTVQRRQRYCAVCDAKSLGTALPFGASTYEWYARSGSITIRRRERVGT